MVRISLINRANEKHNTENEQVEQIRKRFLAQNKALARVNSNLSMKVRTLENCMTQLTAENISLRMNNINEEMDRKKWFNEKLTDLELEVSHKMAEISQLFTRLREVEQLDLLNPLHHDLPEVQSPSPRKSLITNRRSGRRQSIFIQPFTETEDSNALVPVQQEESGNNEVDDMMYELSEPNAGEGDDIIYEQPEEEELQAESHFPKHTFPAILPSIKSDIQGPIINSPVCRKSQHIEIKEEQVRQQLPEEHLQDHNLEATENNKETYEGDAIEKQSNITNEQHAASMEPNNKSLVMTIKTQIPPPTPRSEKEDGQQVRTPVKNTVQVESNVSQEKENIVEKTVNLPRKDLTSTPVRRPLGSMNTNTPSRTKHSKPKKLKPAPMKEDTMPKQDPDVGSNRRRSRSRKQVNYALPSLRTKMRRPTGKLADAVDNGDEELSVLHSQEIKRVSFTPTSKSPKVKEEESVIDFSFSSSPKKEGNELPRIRKKEIHLSDLKNINSEPIANDSRRRTFSRMVADEEEINKDQVYRDPEVSGESGNDHPKRAKVTKKVTKGRRHTLVT